MRFLQWLQGCKKRRCPLLRSVVSPGRCKTQVLPSQHSMSRFTVSDLGDVPTNHQHIFRVTVTACTQSKTGMVAYLGDVHTLCVDTIIILSDVIVSRHTHTHMYTNSLSRAHTLSGFQIRTTHPRLMQYSTHTLTRTHTHTPSLSRTHTLSPSQRRTTHPRLILK